MVSSSRRSKRTSVHASERANERASDRAYTALVTAIQSGDLAPGAVIGEVEQSQRLGISRTPVREAIGRLIADGLVRQQSARVTVVSGFDVSDIEELFVARRALEEAAAKLAAGRRDRTAFEALSREFAAAAPLDDDAGATAYAELIDRFEAAIDGAVDNVHLTSALRKIRTHLARARELTRANRARLDASIGEHALIVDAIARGDQELAAHATHVHLHNALTAILESIAASKEGLS